MAALTRLRSVVTRGRRSQVTARAAREAITRSQAKATAVSIMPSVRTVAKSDACGGTNCGTIARKNRPTLGLSAHDIRPEQNAAAGARSPVGRSREIARRLLPAAQQHPKTEIDQIQPTGDLDDPVRGGGLFEQRGQADGNR